MGFAVPCSCPFRQLLSSWPRLELPRQHGGEQEWIRHSLRTKSRRRKFLAAHRPPAGRPGINLLVVGLPERSEQLDKRFRVVLINRGRSVVHQNVSRRFP